MSVDIAPSNCPALREFGPSPWKAFRAGPLVRQLAVPVAAHGASTALVALAAGLLCGTLAGSGTAAGSISAWDVTDLLYLGLAATLVKTVASTWLAGAEERWLKESVGSIRRRVAGELLASTETSRSLAPASVAVALTEVDGSFRHGCLKKIRALAQVVPLGLTLIALSWKAALVALAFAIPAWALSARLRQRSAGTAQSALKMTERLQQELDDLIVNLDLWRAYGAGTKALSHLGRVSRRAQRAAVRAETARAAASGANEVLGALALLVASLLADAELFTWTASGSWLSCAVVVFLAYRPLRDLNDAEGWIARGRAALGRLDTLTPRRPVTLPPAPNETPRGNVVRLEVEALRARGRGGRTSFAASTGEVVCLVGATGSGKTSLFRVLLGFVPGEGLCRLQGVEISEAPSGPGSRPFAWVPQDTLLVSRSIEANVELFGSRISARDALEQIGASELSGALAQRVGAPGRELSGGERRQLALARALATDLPILLLDEPTVGLDAGARARVLGAIFRLRATRLVIIATHDHQLATLADQVVSIGNSTSLSAAAE